jgi:hypothetical protein
MNYKLYINGNIASTGPGRGEAPVMASDGRFRAQVYGSTFSRTVWRLYGGAKGLVMWYSARSRT